VLRARDELGRAAVLGSVTPSQLANVELLGHDVGEKQGGPVWKNKGRLAGWADSGETGFRPVAI
jgi:hypothetical protein